MSLRAFHLLFIALSALLAAFCAAWAMDQYRVDHRPLLIAGATASLAAALALVVYGTAFQRKTRNL